MLVAVVVLLNMQLVMLMLLELAGLVAVVEVMLEIPSILNLQRR
jgi:hypothetical protein